MARVNQLSFAFNRGEISPLLLGRTDLEHLRLAAHLQVNWLPRVLGPMMLRPGSQYIGGVYGNALGKMIPFVAKFNDTAVIDLTPNIMRVWVNDALVTRASVGTTIAAFTSWTTTTTGTANIATGATGLTISNLNVGAVATAITSLTIANADVNTEHALRIVVTNGPINFRIGTQQGYDDVFLTETLDTGTYSMAFTPGVNTVYVEFISTIGAENYSTLSNTQPQGLQSVNVASISVEPAGVMALPTPWGASEMTLPPVIKYSASADVTFVAADGAIPQYQINRYSPTSWAVVNYKPVKGPMNAVLGNKSIFLTPGATSGNTTLTANQPIFSQDDVGTLFRLYHTSQNISQTISFSDTYTDTIRVTGVSTTSTIVAGSVVDSACTDRNFTFSIAGTWTGTVNLERSYESATDGFTVYETYTSNQTNVSIQDGLNNEIIWYRLGPGAGQLTSGAPVCTLNYPGGGGAGICHVTGFISPLQVKIEILVPFFNNSNAFDWHQSEWSGNQGYPTSTAIHEGRLWWAGSDRWWGSTSDDYSNFDFDAIGDASYIDVSVGQGPIANINWLLSLDNLLGGADTAIITARSDAIQSPLTPTNFNLRFATTTGSSAVQAVKIDNRAIYIDQSGRKIFEASYDLYTYNYKSVELSNLNPDIGFAGYVGMAIQRNPDTRIYLVRADGQIVCLLYDAEDQVKAFWRIQTAGSYEDVIVLPGVIEDQVYVKVNRNGVRSLEKFARMDECQGGAMNKQGDCFSYYSGSAFISSLTAPQLANQQVVCWADGVDYSPLTADSTGKVTLPISSYGKQIQVQNMMVGLGYTADFLSAKLAYAAKEGSAINQFKRVDHIGFVLQNTHCQGLQFGMLELSQVGGAGSGFSAGFSSGFSGIGNILTDTGYVLDNLPQVEDGAVVPANTIYSYYDRQMMEFPGNSDTDARIYLQASAPRPCTVVAMTFSIETSN